MTEAKDPAAVSPVETRLVYWHGVAALATLLASVAFGIVVAAQFLYPDLAGNWPALGWGRLRYAHTQGIMFGWLGNAFLAFLYHGVPVLTDRQVTSRRLGLVLFCVWNFAVVVPGWVLVLLGVSQPLEWAEFPPIVDAFTVLAFVLAAVQFLPPFFHRSLDKLYVSSWYIIGALVFTLLAFPMGNFAPYYVPGAAGAAISGLWIHDAVGLFVTPLALAIIYYVIPAATGRPVYSHFLSMLGFWGLFFFYPLNGTHHYVYSVIPMTTQAGAIAASAMLGVVVVIVVTNLFLSLRGAGVFPREVALRFVAMSVFFYVVVSIQGALQAQMSINKVVHFTDWVIGHSHLAMLGFATFAGIGGIIHAWQRIGHARYNARALEWSFWLLFAGVTFMVTDLTLAGLRQAALWQDGAPWLDSVRASGPYWSLRLVSAVPITAGFICLLAGLTTGSRGAGARAVDRSRLDEGTEPVVPVLVPAAGNEGSPIPAGRGLMMSYVVASVAGLTFFVLSVSLLGIWPARVLAEQTARTSPPHPMPLSAAEERGRLVYAREGCAYCHTQQIRYLDADIKRFGAPTLAWETSFDFPHLMGTRRVGPDLSRAGGTRTDNWQFVHLFAPRSVVPQSVMPSYAALFDGSPDRPARDARDLVAYLDTLGRARELAWPDGDATARTHAGDDRWSRMAFDSPVLNASPARTRERGGAPLLESILHADGSALWHDHCAGCHGAEGAGDGPAAQWLSPAPTDLTRHEYAPAYIADVLWNGVAGTAMPAWRDRPETELAALSEVVRGLYSAPAESPSSAEQLDTGALVYATHCAECHGERGDGNGFAAAQWPVMPADFRGQRPTLDEAIRVVREGVDGTSMAPWTDRLDDDEIASVAHYVRRFYQGQNYVIGDAP